MTMRTRTPGVGGASSAIGAVDAAGTADTADTDHRDADGRAGRGATGAGRGPGASRRTEGVVGSGTAAPWSESRKMAERTVQRGPASPLTRGAGALPPASPEWVMTPRPCIQPSQALWRTSARQRLWSPEPSWPPGHRWHPGVRTARGAPGLRGLLSSRLSCLRRSAERAGRSARLNVNVPPSHERTFLPSL